MKIVAMGSFIYHVTQQVPNRRWGKGEGGLRFVTVDTNEIRFLYKFCIEGGRGGLKSHFMRYVKSKRPLKDSLSYEKTSF